MTRLLPYIAAAIAAIGTVWMLATAYRAGQANAFASIARDQAQATAALNRAEAARLAAETERDRLARELEDAANADPVLVPQCLGPDRVRRLNAIR